jgi:hypothetical protein
LPAPRREFVVGAGRRPNGKDEQDGETDNEMSPFHVVTSAW